MANASGQAEWPRVSPASQARSRSLPVRISARGHALPTELEWIGTTPAHPTLSQLSLHTAPRSQSEGRAGRTDYLGGDQSRGSVELVGPDATVRGWPHAAN